MRQFKRMTVEVNSRRVDSHQTRAVKPFRLVVNVSSSVQVGKCGTQIEVNSQRVNAHSHILSEYA